MSKRTDNKDYEISESMLDDLEGVEEFQIDSDDFAFLVDSEGNLKTVFGSDDLFDDPPDNVVKILAIFGIGDARNLSRAGITIH